MEQTVNLYQQLVNNLKNALDQNFKNQLFKEKKIETFDSKWKSARQNLERYLRQVASQNIGFETVLLSDGFFLYEDVAALLVDLLWQETHNELEVKETLYYYKIIKFKFIVKIS